MRFHTKLTFIHMSSMFDERSLTFLRFRSPTLIFTTSFLPTPTNHDIAE